MGITKEIRLVLLRSLFDRMQSLRRPGEAVVSFIREALDRECDRRAAYNHFRKPAHAEGLGSFEDLRELIDDALEPDETTERFVRRAVARVLRERLAARTAAAQPEREVRLPTQAERAAALLEAMEARRLARQEAEAEPRG